MKDYLLINNSLIKVIKGDITKFSFDAYVNAANSSLIGGGGVDYSIHKAANREKLINYNKLYNNGYCEVGEAKISPGFESKAKYIIHTVGPIYSFLGKDESELLLSNCYINSLNLAKEYKIKTIGFSNISTGVYGYPIKEATKISVNSIIDWINKNKDYSIEIYIVCYLDSNYKSYLDYLFSLN